MWNIMSNSLQITIYDLPLTSFKQNPLDWQVSVLVNKEIFVLFDKGGILPPPAETGGGRIPVY